MPGPRGLPAEGCSWTWSDEGMTGGRRLEDLSSARQDTGREGAAPWVWRFSSREPDASPFGHDFFLRDAAVVARDLLGTRVRSTWGGVMVEGVVVETEAYVGPHDPASHGAARIGETLRNRSMFGPPGRAYVYRSYGIHWCLNVVTGEPGFPAAVLIRALDPLAGLAEMARRREGRLPLCAGPGRLSQALGITGKLDGHSLADPPLQLLRGWRTPEDDVAVSGRVGVAKAADWPLRFYLRGHPEVSRGPREGPLP
jgi:DNA-3-methyladenine glycosylase